ncbi:hypothetical protein Naga_101535g1 [Nannochloropsis gaditana]|uniref:Uncharacterized protein n=1 Tax=Nannochloropsis gaditana TaxID=72520 RepID=W7TUZ3_9STRA|nr:hypothetical protein Naga_101535g1 [Nannochloropsis gaditana]
MHFLPRKTVSERSVTHKAFRWSSISFSRLAHITNHPSAFPTGPSPPFLFPSLPVFPPFLPPSIPPNPRTPLCSTSRSPPPLPQPSFASPSPTTSRTSPRPSASWAWGSGMPGLTPLAPLSGTRS